MNIEGAGNREQVRGHTFPRCVSLGLALLFIFSVTSVHGQKLELGEPDAAFQQKDYKTALALYIQMRDIVAQNQSQYEQKTWASMTAQIVRCHTALGNQEQAALQYFLLCLETPQDATPLDCIPLPWFVPTNEIRMGMRPHEKMALDRLDSLKFKSPGPAATLLAAAVLASSADAGRRSQGLALLRNLESTPASEGTNVTMQEQQRNVTLLASAFLWKQTIPRIRQKEDLKLLQTTLDRIPPPLRAGPYYRYGLAAKQAGEHEMAVLALMRLPTLFPEQKTLCQESLREAAASLDKRGRPDQAAALRHEAETPE